jgi:hypothetical protein
MSIPAMVHTNINDRPLRERTMAGSIGEGMVDMGSNPTGDGRVVAIKRAAANLIDMIEQMEIVGDRDAGSKLKKQASHLVAEACDLAVQAAIQRDPAPQSRNERETSDDDPQGAPV